MLKMNCATKSCIHESHTQLGSAMAIWIFLTVLNYNLTEQG